MLREQAIRWSTYMVCIVLLIWPALYNGYPILYSDTATYIASGMELETPMDRPITYGIFILLTSFGGITLWTTIICQAVIVLAVIDGTIRCVRNERATPSAVLAIIVLLLCSFTSLPWLVSQIMPDIFTPVLALSIILLVLRREKASRWRMALLHLLFFFSVSVHLSHLLFTVFILVALLLLRGLLVRYGSVRYERRPIWTMLGLTALSFPIMSSAMAKSGNIFAMGAMVEHGIAKAYLDRNCATAPVKLCAWRERLPAKAYAFIWEPDGPMSAYADWREANEEFGGILRGTLSDGHFLRMHVSASLRATIAQAGMNDIGDGWGVFQNGSGVHRTLAQHLPGDLGAMEKSLQQRSRLALVNCFIPVHRGALWIAALALLPLFILALRRSRVFVLPTTVIVLLSVVLNAWISGTFSGEVDRYGCKLIWMLPLLTLLLATAIRTSLFNKGERPA